MSDNAFMAVCVVCVFGVLLSILLFAAVALYFETDKYGRCLDACKSDPACISACRGGR